MRTRNVRSSVTSNGTTAKFLRAIRLAAPVDEEAVEASCDNGLLTVRLPKAEVAKPHKIHVKTG
jgi:HSP20 family protein